MMVAFTGRSAMLLTVGALAGCTPSREESGPVPLPEGTVTVQDIGFATPESVVHDPTQDLYFVSNINGGPLDVDGNGFISRLLPEGGIDLKWIDGTKPGVTLNAPKGMALAGPFLFVADINTLRWFDRMTGAPAGAIELPGATFLNGVAAHREGSVYFTDSGLRAGADGFEPTGTDAVYRLNPDFSIDTLAMGADLGGPNGIALAGDSVYVVSFGSGEFYRVVNGGKADVVHLPNGGLDGLVIFEDMVFISSWAGESIYRGFLGQQPWELFNGIPAPADIGHDYFRHRLLVPLFMDDVVKFAPLVF